MPPNYLAIAETQAFNVARALQQVRVEMFHAKQDAMSDDQRRRVQNTHAQLVHAIQCIDHLKD